jgi:hypothetical protein
MDLVISIDNSTVHMAGALNAGLGNLPAVSDWRWMLDRSDSPWYPSVRLFRAGVGRRVDPRHREGRGRVEARRSPIGPRPRVLDLNSTSPR